MDTSSGFPEAGVRSGPRPSTATVEVTCPAGSDRGAPAFVLGIWALCSLAALAFVGKFGRDVPFLDDWSFVPILAGARPLDASWLWSQHNEHRILLPRLILLVLGESTGWDFRAGMFFNATALAAVSLLMVRAAARVRGRACYTDAFLPLVLLSLGNRDNLLWNIQVCVVLPACLAGLILMIIARNPRPLRPRCSALAGTSLLLLPLCGGFGVAMVPAFILWLISSGQLRRRPGEHDDGRGRLIILASIAATLLILAFYFVGYGRPAHQPARHEPLALLTTSVQFLSTSLGSPAGPLWPLSGAAIATLLLATVAAILASWRSRPEERPRMLGFLWFMAAIACLAVAVGWGRGGGAPDAGLKNRYVTMAIPILCCTYFAWILYGPPTLRTFVQTCLFAGACALYPVNALQARDLGRERIEAMGAFERDRLAGAPPRLLAERHSPDLYPWSEAYLAECLQMLYRSGVGRYRPLRDNPAPR